MEFVGSIDLSFIPTTRAITHVCMCRNTGTGHSQSQFYCSVETKYSTQDKMGSWEHAARERLSRCQPGPASFQVQGHNHYTLASETHILGSRSFQPWGCSCHLEQRLESDVEWDRQVLEYLPVSTLQISVMLTTPSCKGLRLRAMVSGSSVPQRPPRAAGALAGFLLTASTGVSNLCLGLRG